jgi:ElaB/YqjD/DUF883 family membrane-anchored ribosome-binding protein
MLTNNIKTVRTDMRTLVRDAQELFREASLATGEKAEELRSRGLVLLDAAMEKAQEVQTVAVERGKVAAQSTDEYVRANPWQAMGVAAGAGLLLGMLMSRR